MKISKNKKIALFTDIHLGEHGDSPKWHKISLDFCSWVCEELKEKEIKDIIITGDIFHDRNEINLSTIDVAYNFFNILKDFNVIITTGNHDCYYKNNSEINSLSIFKHSKHIKVIDDYEFYEDFCGKKVSFVPWGYDISKLKKSDYIFGHFEINGFRLNNAKICENGEKTENILLKGKKIFSGHFHHNDERNFGNKGEIVYIGSPFQFNFGDIGSKRGYYILDFENDTREFFENTISPVHVKIRTSEIPENNKVDKSLIHNNIVRLIVDNELKDSRYNKISSVIESCNPFIFDIKNEYEDSVEIKDDFVVEDFNIFDSIDEYIDIIDIKHKLETKKYMEEKYLKYGT
jgi:DNA repair exonuclease SbcCD nuclease subunit